MPDEAIVDLLMKLHALCGLLMAGLCLFVAGVHYPLFAEVARLDGEPRPDGSTPGCGFVRYEQLHAKKTTLVVAPLMLLELAGATGLVIVRGAGIDYLMLVLVGAVWGVTFLVNVPQHAKLAQGFDAKVHRGLLLWHSVRTCIWVAKGMLAMWVAS
jgi:hypothetical protein